ncbi:hypothetical protein SteCoe_13074 [Stentor coeruleus]|uniref:Uncharacterized protein n=1 Tax=Stentor coeruleus TaxID=5963 RepID=A0A1R2C9F2_9CILI|nr:hypothetical protein SteCoe_13074 [Stentor coeruleus]
MIDQKRLTIPKDNFLKSNQPIYDPPSTLISKFTKYYSSTELNSSKKSFCFSIKDPGSKPLCDKSASFNQNFYNLPESRLKLVVTDTIIKNDQAALKRMSQKLEAEEFMEDKKQQWLCDFRNNILTSNAKKKQNTEELQKKTGLVKFNPMPHMHRHSTTERIETLAIPKSITKGFAEDYSESYGLLGAGILETGRSILPKSARVPGYKSSSGFSQYANDKKQGFYRNRGFCIGKNSNEVFSNKEVKECMKEINEFHKRYGELKGRVGFPQIYLEKYKN